MGLVVQSRFSMPSGEQGFAWLEGGRSNWTRLCQNAATGVWQLEVIFLMLKTWSEFEMLWKNVGSLLLLFYLFVGVLHLGVDPTFPAYLCN